MCTQNNILKDQTNILHHLTQRQDIKLNASTNARTKNINNKENQNKNNTTAAYK